jgi:hypothetical protein
MREEPAQALDNAEALRHATLIFYVDHGTATPHHGKRFRVHVESERVRVQATAVRELDR